MTFFIVKIFANDIIIGYCIIIVILTALRTGAKMIRATNQRAMITRTVLFRLNSRRNPIGFLIAKYLSMLIAVMVKIEAATATPTS